MSSIASRVWDRLTGPARTFVPPSTSTPVSAGASLSSGGGRGGRRDGYENVLTGLGVTGKDPRMSTTMTVERVTHDEAKALWTGDDIAARAIEIIPREAFKRPFTVNVADKKVSEAVSSYLEGLDAYAKCRKAAEFSRAYGGGALFPVINDASGATSDTALAVPLVRERIGKISALHELEARELQVASWYENISDKGWRKPKTFWLNPISSRGGFFGRRVEVHESRLIIFQGIQVSADTRDSVQMGWGDSRLTRAKQAMADFGAGYGGVAALMSSLGQGILSMDGLAELMGEDGEEGESEGLVVKRLQIMALMRSTLNMMVMDGKDKYAREATPVAGAAEILDKLGVRCGAAVDLPITVMLGISPAGLNATGESDIRLLYDRVSGAQSTEYQKPCEQLAELVMLAGDGPTRGKVPDVWSVEWLPLWQPSEQERETTRALRTTNDVALVQARIATANEIRQARYSGDTYSYELRLEGDAPDEEPTADDIAAVEEARRIASGKPEIDVEDLDDQEVDDDVVEAGDDDEEEPMVTAPEETDEERPRSTSRKPARATMPTPAATVPVDRVLWNGAQLASALAIAEAAAAKRIPSTTAKGILMSGLQVSQEEADAIVPPDDFQPPGDGSDEEPEA